MVSETPMVTKFLRERPDDSFTIDAALENGAYEMLAKAFATSTDDLITQVTDSVLRGLGFSDDELERILS